MTDIGEEGSNSDGAGRIALGGNKARELRMNEADWRDIRRAASKSGMSVGNYVISLQRTRNLDSVLSPSDHLMWCALIDQTTQITRAIINAEPTDDRIFELLLDLHRTVTRATKAI